MLSINKQNEVLFCVSVRKKKMEEEEADLKKKNTDAAYQGISFTFKGVFWGKHQYRIMFQSFVSFRSTLLALAQFRLRYI